MCLLRRVYTERAYFYKLLENLCKFKKKLVETLESPRQSLVAHENISRNLYVEVTCRLAQELLTSQGSVEYFVTKMTLETDKMEIKTTCKNLI